MNETRKQKLQEFERSKINEHLKLQQDRLDLLEKQLNRAQEVQSWKQQIALAKFERVIMSL
jgi:hypothetical protein